MQSKYVADRKDGQEPFHEKKRNFSPEKNEKEDRPGEREKRARIRAMYGENRPCSAVPGGAPFAICKNGTFVGRSRDGIASFKGIPFALPPVGDLRWKPPVAPEDADGVTEAFYFGHTPIQTEWPSEEGSYYPQSEDCLTLNVWAAEGGDNGNVTIFGESAGGGTVSLLPIMPQAKGLFRKKKKR